MTTGGASASPVVSCGEVVTWLEYPKLFSEEMLDALESDAKAVLEMWPGVSMLRMWAEEARIGGTGCSGCSPMTFAQLEVELKQRERAAEKILDLWGLVTCDRVADLVAALPSAWVVSPT